MLFADVSAMSSSCMESRILLSRLWIQQFLMHVLLRCLALVPVSCFGSCALREFMRVHTHCCMHAHFFIGGLLSTRGVLGPHLGPGVPCSRPMQ